jgi:hypothetical protein
MAKATINRIISRTEKHMLIIQQIRITIELTFLLTAIVMNTAVMKDTNNQIMNLKFNELITMPFIAG